MGTVLFDTIIVNKENEKMYIIKVRFLGLQVYRKFATDYLTDTI